MLHDRATFGRRPDGRLGPALRLTRRRLLVGVALVS